MSGRDPKRAVSRAAAKGKAARGRTIDAAAETVAKNRGRKPGLSARQKVLRDTVVVSRKAQGWSVSRIAQENDLTTRQVERILADFRKTPSGLDAPPMQIVEDLMRTFTSSIGDLEKLAQMLMDEHPAVGVSALRLLSSERADLLALQRMLGVIPANLGIFRAEADLRHLGHVTLDKLAEFERGECSAEEVARFVREDVMEQALRDLPSRS